jgi:hypothetical protein
VQGVAVEQLGEMADGREAARAAVRVALRAAEIRGQRVRPRLREAPVDDL